MNKRILVVDDETLITDLLQSICEIEEIETVICHNLQDAMDTIKSDHFDAIFLDLHLKNEFGSDLLIEVKNQENHRNKDTPFFILSGLMEENEEKAIHGLYEILIEKPFDVDTILKVISDL